MAHEIYETDKAVFFQNPAWHGLGSVVDTLMSPTQALEISGADFLVEKRPLYVKVGDTDIVVPDKVVTFRTDTQSVLGVVGSDYSVIQNSEICDIAYSLGNDIKVESLCTLKEGRQMFILLKTDTMDADKHDVVHQYMLLTTSHDGSMKLRALPTSVRVVCNNTLTQAISQGKLVEYAISHKKNAKLSIEDMKLALGRYKKDGYLFKEEVQTLVKTEVNGKMLKEFWESMFHTLNPNHDVSNEKHQIEKVATLNTWLTTFETERVITSGGANLWLAANAVTQSIQHGEAKRKTETGAENRLISNWTGKNALSSVQVMQKALQKAKSLGW